MTPFAFAIFVMAVGASLAAVLIGWVLTLWRRQGRVGEWWGVAAGLAAAFLLASALALAGWAMPDALDRLPAEERRAIGPALEATAECGSLPFARVLEVEVDRSADGGLVLRYACGLTHLGTPRFSGEARCVGGEWHVAGFMEVWSEGSCSP